VNTVAHQTGKERRLLGLRQQPGRIALWFMRLPRPLYHRGWGRLLGHTFFLIIPEQRLLSEEEAVAAGTRFRGRRPGRLRLFATILGWGDLSTEPALRDFVRSHPFVSFRPERAAQPE
jgi:hypothetical protein